jgi:hypothetical protein
MLLNVNTLLSNLIKFVIIAHSFIIKTYKGDLFMGQPKKQSSPRKTGTRRSHLVLKLARRVNGTSPIKVKTTKRETGKKKLVVAVEAVKTAVVKKAAPAKKATK